MFGQLLGSWFAVRDLTQPAFFLVPQHDATTAAIGPVACRLERVRFSHACRTVVLIFDAWLCSDPAPSHSLICSSRTAACRRSLPKRIPSVLRIPSAIKIRYTVSQFYALLVNGVMLSINTLPNDQQPCYFSIQPAAYSHFSTETPCYSPLLSPIETPADPTNPYLAYRSPQTFSAPLSPTLSTQSVLQMQTAAAHKHSPSRPRPYPVQNVLHVTSDDSSSSESSLSDSAKSSLDVARCSRCQRTPSTDIRTGKSNMVQYGLNLWYCNRCAAMVGLTNR